MVTLERTLKRLIKKSGLTLYRISEDSGVSYAPLFRFVDGERSLSLDSLELLIRYFKIQFVTPDPNSLGGGSAHRQATAKRKGKRS